MSTLKLKPPGRFLLPFVCFLVTLVHVPMQESRSRSLDIGQYNDIAYIDFLNFWVSCSTTWLALLVNVTRLKALWAPS